MKKDYVPRIIEDGDSQYFAFVHGASKSPRIYRNFVSDEQYPRIHDREKYVRGDRVYKLTLSTYFHFAHHLKQCKLKLNLKQIQHALNRNN